MDLLQPLQAALAERYRLVRELGAGGMATVYLAEDLRHHRQVALKVLRPELAVSLGAERFQREIQIAAQLQHPNILPLLDSGEAAGFLYYVMPYVEGQSLRERLAREGALPVSDAVRILRDVVDALTEAHAHGVVHRDIKPENIMLRGRHALVADFGVAKAVSEATGRQTLTTAGVALGTPAYMAPEQATADPHLDHRVDIYAVGAVGYELLTGRPVFLGTTPQAVLTAHVTEAPAPITRHREAVPRALEALLMRCLEKQAADRWQSAEELLPQLEALGTPSGGMTPTDTRPVRAARPRRRPAVTSGLLALVAVVVAGGYLLLRPRSTVIASATRIAVLPFAPAAPDTALERLGRDLVVLLSGNLDGVGDISVVDAGATLARSAGRREPYSAAAGAEVARSFGAGSVLLGTLLRTRDTVRAEAVLHATGDGRIVARAHALALVEESGRLSDSLAWGLLQDVWRKGPPPSPHVTTTMTRSFDALRAFLSGEHLTLDGRYREAAVAYEQAMAADSAFWLAYWRYAYARNWNFQSVAPEVVRTYEAHRAELPERDRLLIEAGMAGARSQRLALYEAVTRRYPESYTAWWYYGDMMLHYGPLFGHPGADAIAAIERVAAQNPAVASVWDHLAGAYLLMGDSSGMRRALANLERLGAGATLRREYGYDVMKAYRVQLAGRFGGLTVAELVDSMVAIAAEATPTSLFPWMPLGLTWSMPAAGPALAEALAARALPRASLDVLQWSAAYAWCVRGAWDSALVVMDRLVAAGGARPHALDRYRLATVAAWYGAIDPDAAEQRRAAVVPEVRDSVAEAELAWLDGVLAVARRDANGVRTARERVRRTRALPASVLDRALAAYEADLAGRRADATRQLVALERLRGDSAYIWSRQPTLDPINRLVLGRWLLEARDPAEAAYHLMWYEAWYPNTIIVSLNIASMTVAMFERARAEEALGRPASAARHYEEFLRRYDLPVAAHRPLVVAARAALARIRAGAGN